jgi:predicted HTH transcriptional regulator
MKDPTDNWSPPIEKSWTFLTNHALVLLLVARHPSITGRELAQELGITERTVRLIIADLEKTKYLSKKREGRHVKYCVNHKMPMRHRTQRDMAIGDFFKVLGMSRSPAVRK